MTRVTSRSEPLFQSVRIRLRFASTQIIRFSSGSLFAILKNTVRLRFYKNSIKPVYKTPVPVRFDSLFFTTFQAIIHTILFHSLLNDILQVQIRYFFFAVMSCFVILFYGVLVRIFKMLYFSFQELQFTCSSLLQPISIVLCPCSLFGA